MNTEVKSSEAAEFFISHAPNFSDDLSISDIDEKHQKIVASAYEKISDSSGSGWKNFRNWGAQSDLGAPAQLSKELIRINGFTKTTLRYFYAKLFRRHQESCIRSTLLDDLEILSRIGARKLLEENPVSETPGSTIFYSTDGLTLNQRWTRYIYLLKRILDLKVLSKGGVWVDVGSYYGGLQGLVRKYSPETSLVLVDFHHQLCRSYIYLSKLYPSARHIMPDEIQNFTDFEKLPPGSIMYVPVGDFSKIQESSADLVTNFFSLGEMRHVHFQTYMSSKLFRGSKALCLVNRFVSAPFFERTYDQSSCKKTSLFNRKLPIAILPSPSIKKSLRDSEGIT